MADSITSKLLIPHLVRICCSSSREAGRRLRKGPAVSYESTASTLVPAEPDSPAGAGAGACAGAAANGNGNVQHQHQHRRTRNSPSTSSDFPACTASSSASLFSPETPGAGSAGSGSGSCHSDFVSPFTQSPLSEVSSNWSGGQQSQQQQLQHQLQHQQQQRIERALLALCQEFEQRLRAKFADFDERLETRPDSARAFVTSELESLFADGCVHWGRVVAVFVLARQLCCRCEAEGNSQLAGCVQAWVCQFIEDKLWDWVCANGGWLGLAHFYEDAGCIGGFSSVTSQLVETLGLWAPPLSSIIALAAASVAVVLAVSYVSRR